MSEIGELLEEFEHIGSGLDVRPPVATRRIPDMAGFLDIPAVLLGPGVYALIRHGEIVYIGKAKRLFQRLYSHDLMMRKRQEGKPVQITMHGHKVKAIVFTDIKVYPCAVSDLSRIEQQMIERYRPRYNERLKPINKVSLSSLGFAMPSIAQVLPFVRRV